MLKLSEIWQKAKEDMVERRIEDEIIILPISSGVGDDQEALFSLNETAEEIWKMLDGKRRIGEIIDELLSFYEVGRQELIEDVLGFLEELKKRRFIMRMSECLNT